MPQQEQADQQAMADQYPPEDNTGSQNESMTPMLDEGTPHRNTRYLTVSAISLASTSFALLLNLLVSSPDATSINRNGRSSRGMHRKTCDEPG